MNFLHRVDIILQNSANILLEAGKNLENLTQDIENIERSSTQTSSSNSFST